MHNVVFNNRKARSMMINNYAYTTRCVNNFPTEYHKIADYNVNNDSDHYEKPNYSYLGLYEKKLHIGLRIWEYCKCIFTLFLSKTFRINALNTWQHGVIRIKFYTPTSLKIEKIFKNKHHNLTFPELKGNSQNFLKMIKQKQSPTTTNNLEKIGNTAERQNKILTFAKETRPLLDPKVKKLINDFLENKKKNGTETEKRIYQEMTLHQFVERLLSKRPLMFMNGTDYCMFRDGKKAKNTAKTKEDFITNSKDIMRMEEYLSYDEMQIGALLSVSGPTFFINDGTLDNKGKPGNKGSFEEEGIIAGSVGCRFERKGVMEYQHMLITPTQNTAENGYGVENKEGKFKPWSTFYGIDHFPTYKEMVESKNHKRYVEISKDIYLDIEIYKKRIRLSYEPFLKDMNTRAKKEKNVAYVRLTGLGLGAWAVNKELQENLMHTIVDEIIAQNNFSNISHIEFAFSKKQNNRNVKDQNKHNIVITNGANTTTATKLPKEHQNKLFGANYAWDGASFPGNEYWDGNLSGSMDPATAAASQIKDLHNIYVNPYLAENIKQIF